MYIWNNQTYYGLLPAPLHRLHFHQQGPLTAKHDHFLCLHAKQLVVLKSYFGVEEEKFKLQVVFRVVGSKKEQGPSGSVSDVVAQENNVVCDDGGRLTPDLVFVHVLPIVQFSFHQNPGPFLDVLVGDVPQTRFEHGDAMPRRLLADVPRRAHLSVPGAPHLVRRHRENGDGVTTLHLSHHRVLSDSPQQLHAIYRSFQDEVCICASVSHQLLEDLRRSSSQHLVCLANNF